MKIDDQITIVVFDRRPSEATKGNPEHGRVTCESSIVRETATQWITREGMRFDKGSLLAVGLHNRTAQTLRIEPRAGSDE